MTFRFPVVACLVLAATVLPAQDQPAPPVFRSGTTLVLVPALVRTAKGEMVYALAADDFSVTDDGVAQQLRLEEDTDSEPLALAIVVQTGGAGAKKLDAYRHLGATLETLVGAVPHHLAVIAFDGVPQVVEPFTPDVDTASAAMAALQPGDGGAAILDSVAAAVDLLRTQPPEYRRAILLISETLDHGSQTKMEAALRAISDTNTAIYSLGFSSTRSDMKAEAKELDDRETPGPAGGCMSRAKPDSDNDGDRDTDAKADASADSASAPAKQQNRAMQAYDCLSLLAPPLRLAKMAAIAAMNGLHKNVPETVAQQTGGEYLKFENQRNLERDLITFSSHVPNRYVLSFSPTSRQPGLHAIEVKLQGRPGLVVTARKSYWADVEAAPR